MKTDLAKDDSATHKILTAFEWKTLAAIAERIFPKTNTPGAVEIGALSYIKIALAGDYAALLPLYRDGLRAVERHAREKFARGFGALLGFQQDQVLSDFENGNVAKFKTAAEFFETVRYHVVEGIFCEPHYGGNKDMQGWRMVHFPGQQLGYGDPYINRFVDLEPVAIEYEKERNK